MRMKVVVESVGRTENFYPGQIVRVTQLVQVAVHGCTADLWIFAVNIVVDIICGRVVGQSMHSIQRKSALKCISLVHSIPPVSISLMI